MPTPPNAEFLALQQALAGRFSLERELGRGGMGVVYLARDVALERPVAIKLLPIALAAQPDLRERFLREARTAANLSHPNVVPIHLVEERGDLVYFVMMFVDGETLGQRVHRGGPLTASQAARVVQEVAWALAYAHGRGVVHRDIKPDNILLDRDSGRAMVTDFGIAHVAGIATMSRAGEFVGTAHYMSPEQATGDEIDGRSDLFSLGVTAYFAITGTLPFDGPHVPAIVTRIVNEEAPPLGTVRPGLPAPLRDAIERCLAKSPDERFANGEALANAVGAGAMTADIPPAIRNLLKSTEGFEGLGALGFVAWFGHDIWIAAWPEAKGALIIIAFSVGLAPVLWSAELIRAARQTIKSGFDIEDVRAARARTVQLRREERESLGMSPVEPPHKLLGRQRHWQKLGHAGGAATLGVFIADAAGIISGRASVGLGMLTAIIGALGYLAAFTLKSKADTRRKEPDEPLLGFGERLLETTFGDWLFKVAGRGLQRRAAVSPNVAEHTEMRLAGAADQLFNRLPTAVRAQFASVPRVVARLEAHAAELRRRDAALTAAPMEERAGVRARLGTAVAALENIRLDLMRLDAGIGSPQDLTADLERAQEIGEAIGAQEAASREVAKLLKEPTARTP